jgi:hypothetical protein
MAAVAASGKTAFNNKGLPPNALLAGPECSGLRKFFKNIEGI